MRGCDHILHAGDVGSDEILLALRGVAPLTAIRGNIDRTGACAKLPPTEIVEISGRFFYLVHAREDLDIHPRAAAVDAVVFGHSHRPEISWNDGVLFFNPGSAGPKRFQLPVSMGFLECTENSLHPSIHPLQQ